MNQKGFIPLLIIVIASIVVASAGTGVVLHSQGKLTPFIANVSEVFTGAKNTTIIEEEGLKTEDQQIEQEPKPTEKEKIQGEPNQEQGEIHQQELEDARRKAEEARREAEQLRKEAEKQQKQEELRRQEEVRRLLEEEQRQKEIEEQERQEELRIKQEAEKEKVEMENGLNRLYTQLTLDFIKTAADHLVNIAALLASKFDILIDGRERCAQNYDSIIAETREEGERRITSELEARRGFSTNSALIQQMREDLENDIMNLQKDKERCLAAYPISDPTIGEKITQEVVKLDNLYSRVLVGTNSITEAANMLKEYNSIEARIYSFKDYIPVPLQPVSISSTPRPVPPVGSFSCTISPTGSSYSCRDSFSNMSTSCQLSPTGSSWGCRNSDGSSIRCQVSPTGGSIGCSY